MKISVDLCQALKLFWDVYKNMLQSNGCNVPYALKNHIQNVRTVLLMPHNNYQNDGSILSMPNNVVCAFKVTFTEAELLLTAGLSDHHIKCYKLLKYVTNPEIHPLQTDTSKIKYLFQDKSLVPSYALKIMVWNHQFNQKCFEENDTFSCVFQMLSFHYKGS